jgi:hypothetical protein
MEIKFEATKAELIELAKMAYMADSVFECNVISSNGYQYLYKEEFISALRLFNKMLVQYIGDTGLVEANGNCPEVFTATILMENECERVLDEFKKECFADKVCDALTDRDYEELYGRMGPEGRSEINSEAYHILYDNNMLEIEKYGLKRLRIEE